LANLNGIVSQESTGPPVSSCFTAGGCYSSGAVVEA